MMLLHPPHEADLVSRFSRVGCAEHEAAFHTSLRRSKLHRIQSLLDEKTCGRREAHLEPRRLVHVLLVLVDPRLQRIVHSDLVLGLVTTTVRFRFRHVGVALWHSNWSDVKCRLTNGYKRYNVLVVDKLDGWWCTNVTTTDGPLCRMWNTGSTCQKCGGPRVAPERLSREELFKVISALAMKAPDQGVIDAEQVSVQCDCRSCRFTGAYVTKPSQRANQIAEDHVKDLVSGRLPPEDVASNIAEDLRRAGTNPIPRMLARLEHEALLALEKAARKLQDRVRLHDLESALKRLDKLREPMPEEP